MATRTISNAGGNWESVGTWIEGAVPTDADDVVATGTSGNLTINTTPPISKYCRSLDFTNYVGLFTLASDFTLNIGNSTAGNVKFVNTMTITGTGSFLLVSSFAGTVTITTGGLALNNNLYVNEGSALTTYVLQDDVTNAQRFGMIFNTLSNLTLNNKNITALGFFADTTGGSTLNFGTGTITLTGSNLFRISDTVVIANSSGVNFVLNGTTTFDNKATTSRTWGNLTINGTTHTINGINTFNTLTLSAGTTNTFQINKTTTVTTLICTGTSASPITIKSSSAGTQSTISQAVGTVNGEWLSIRDNIATGGATFNADSNSVSVSNNSGWIFAQRLRNFFKTTNKIKRVFKEFLIKSYKPLSNFNHKY